MIQTVLDRVTQALCSLGILLVSALSWDVLVSILVKSIFTWLKLVDQLYQFLETPYLAMAKYGFMTSYLDYYNTHGWGCLQKCLENSTGSNVSARWLTRDSYREHINLLLQLHHPDVFSGPIQSDDYNLYRLIRLWSSSLKDLISVCQLARSLTVSTVLVLTLCETLLASIPRERLSYK